MVGSQRTSWNLGSWLIYSRLFVYLLCKLCCYPFSKSSLKALKLINVLWEWAYSEHHTGRSGVFFFWVNVVQKSQEAPQTPTVLWNERCPSQFFIEDLWSSGWMKGVGISMTFGLFKEKLACIEKNIKPTFSYSFLTQNIVITRFGNSVKSFSTFINVSFHGVTLPPIGICKKQLLS